MAASSPGVLGRFEVFGPSQGQGAQGLLKVNPGEKEGGWRGRRDPALGPVFYPRRVPASKAATSPRRCHGSWDPGLCQRDPAGTPSSPLMADLWPTGQTGTSKCPVSHTRAHGQAWRRRADPGPLPRPRPFTASRVPLWVRQP